MSAVSFENLFFTTLPGHILYMEGAFWHSYSRTYKAQMSSKSMRTEAVFHLNSRLNSPLNLKRHFNTFIRIFTRNTPVLALKISKRGDRRVYWDAMLWLCFKLPICLFGHTRDTSIVLEKAKVIYFIYM